MGSPHESNQIGEWRTEILPPKTRRALEFLSTQDWLRQDDWYLAGGTAFALYEGHRASLDLDFFYPRKDFNLQRLLSYLSGEQWEVTVAEEGTVYASLSGAKVSFISYPFFVPKQAPRWFGTIQVLQPRDIAVMKLIAVSQRGRNATLLIYTGMQKNTVLLPIFYLACPNNTLRSRTTTITFSKACCILQTPKKILCPNFFSKSPGRK